MSQKIGMITFHRANNLGAALQTFALYTYLNNNLCTTEIIDFYPNNAIPSRNGLIRKSCATVKKILGGKKQQDRYKRYKKFSDFMGRCDLSEKTYFGDKEIEANSPHYDLLISGSDQILNTTLTGDSKAYYLSFAQNIPKISYASSFGRENISDVEKKFINQYLKSFDYVSAREETGKQIIQKFSNLDVELVVDPVFLLPKKEWVKVDKKKEGENYIFVYAMENSPWLINTIEKAKEYFKLPIKIVLGGEFQLPVEGEIDRCCGPLDFLTYIQNADCVITNSFHGMAFSIIFEKRFLCVSHSAKNTRLLNLGKKAKIENQMIHNKSVIEDTEDIEKYIIDGEEAYQRVLNWICASKEYLKKSIQHFLINKDIISVLPKSKCCGCEACFQICPKKAISFDENERGFVFPTIDFSKCIQCGACRDVCPQLVPVKKNMPKKVLAVRNQDKDVLFRSTSGGAFTAISDYIINENGIVFGSILDDNFNCKHIASDNKKLRNKMRGAKYIQSRINNCYFEAKKALLEGRKVLFSGTPCQIAGLKNYLRNIDQTNLFTLDIVCHGVPSRRLFRDHIKWLEKNKESIKKYTFRSKLIGWHGLNVSVTYTDDSIETNTKDVNAFSRFYFNSLITRDSCSTCKYTSIDRVGDITLSDFWTIDTCETRLNDEKGTSCVFVNTNKGEFLLDRAKEKIYIERHTIEEALQPNLTSPTIPNEDCDKFWEDYLTKGFDYCVRKYTQGNLYYELRRKFKAIKKKIELG